MSTISSSAGILQTDQHKLLPAAVSRLGRVAVYVPLIKPRIISLVVFTAVVTCLLAARGRPAVETLLILTVSGTLSAGGAAALNHYVDRDIDPRMKRTRRRPLPMGQIRRPGLVLLAGVTFILVGLALAMTVNLALAFWELTGAFVYVVVYTVWLKRRTPANIVIGGFAGSAAVLGGWAAVDPWLGIVPWLLAALVFFWTPAHFWSLAIARRDDYKRVHVPMLPVSLTPSQAAWCVLIHVLATLATSAWAGYAAHLGLVYLAIAASAGVVFLRAGLGLVRQPGQATGWHAFKLSGPYLGLIFVGILLDIVWSVIRT
jgi:protoheme IX farnesyltransferase